MSVAIINLEQKLVHTFKVMVSKVNVTGVSERGKLLLACTWTASVQGFCDGLGPPAPGSYFAEVGRVRAVERAYSNVSCHCGRGKVEGGGM